MPQLSAKLKHTLLWASLLLLLGCSKPPNGKNEFHHEVVGPNTPWNGEQFDDNAGKFMFAIFTDLTGGERERIFEVAISQLSLLRPELILSVGDLIDGASQNRDSLSLEWESFDRRADRATAPIFYTGGNHDLTGQVLREVWLDRYGKRFYHFVYKDVLFLILDTEDHTPARMEEILQARSAAIAMGRIVTLLRFSGQLIKPTLRWFVG